MYKYIMQHGRRSLILVMTRMKVVCPNHTSSPPYHKILISLKREESTLSSVGKMIKQPQNFVLYVFSA